MSYYLRLLTPALKPMPAEALRKGLEAAGRDDITLVVDETEDEKDWTAIVAYTAEGDAIGLLTRDAAEKPDDLASEELEEFKDELKDALPKSGARWVREYLAKVKTIYAIQVMAAAETEAGEGVPGLILNALQQKLGGIIQADGEGFSNEAGDHVVWQFGDDVEGPWRVAILTPEKTWAAYEIELSNAAHREAFLAGRAPDGVKLAES
jgi:hypothetical protein